MIRSIDNQKGFSLIELMISIAIFGIVVAGVIYAFQDQLKSHNTQQSVLSMQQNARAAMYYMTRELKLAGLDWTGDADAGILTAARNQLRFSMDFTGGYCDGVDDDGNDGADEGCNGNDENGNSLIDEPDEWEWFNGNTNDPNEDVTYMLSNDADGDGVCDGLPTDLNNGSACNLIRRSQAAAAFQILAANIDALNFHYLGRDPSNATCDINCPLVAPVTAANLGDIRSVQITLVARAGQNVPVFSYKVRDDRIYRNQNDDIILPAQNDQFRRLYLTTEIRCRNIGLN